MPVSPPPLVTKSVINLRNTQNSMGISIHISILKAPWFLIIQGRVTNRSRQRSLVISRAIRDGGQSLGLSEMEDNLWDYQRWRTISGTIRDRGQSLGLSEMEDNLWDYQRWRTISGTIRDRGQSLGLSGIEDNLCGRLPNGLILICLHYEPFSKQLQWDQCFYNWVELQ